MVSSVVRRLRPAWLLTLAIALVLAGCAQGRVIGEPQRHEASVDAWLTRVERVEPSWRSAGTGMGKTYGQEGPFRVWAAQHDRDPFQMHEPHDELFDIETTTAGDGEPQPVTGARVTGTYWPADEHWPPIRLLVTETDDPGVYRAEGVRIERNGEWLFYFEIEAGGQRGRVTTGVDYEHSDLP